MPEITDVGASFQTLGDGDGSGYLANLAKFMVPGDGQVIEHLLATGRLSGKKARSSAILINSHFRSSKKPKGYPKGAVDWWSMNEGARIALLVSLMSVSLSGEGRKEISGVLGSVSRFVTRRRRGRDTYEGGEEQ